MNEIMTEKERMNGWNNDWKEQERMDEIMTEKRKNEWMK